VALRKHICSALSSREIDKMPRKWRSVKSRKMVNIEHFEHELRWFLYWRQENYIRCPIQNLEAHRGIPQNIFSALFRPEKWTKRHLNDDLCDLKNGQYWIFRERVEMKYILETTTLLTLSNDRPKDTSWRCANIFIAPFRPKKHTKRRVNDDPWDLKKWSILYILSTSSGEIYILIKKIINSG